MAILDGLNNQRGIQTLITQIANAGTEAQHFSDVLYHTNGSLYCVVSESYSNAVLERRLYLYRSTDNGNAWSLISNLTSGQVDVLPSLLQLDENSTSSDIGIVFLRAANNAALPTGTIMRQAVDVNGTETVAEDPLTGSPTASGRPFLVRYTGGYRVFVGADKFSNAIARYSNTTFNLNNWTSDGNTTILGATNQAMLQRVRNLSNGDMMAVVCYRTGLNGTASNANGLPDNVRADVGVLFSDDEGDTWTTVQNLTGYSGTAGHSENGIDIAIGADAIELIDGRIAVLFQEGKAVQTVDGDTTPSITISGGVYRKAIYHPVHNYLIFGYADDTNGGVYIIDLSTNTVTRLHTASTPAIWENRVFDLALSSDSKYLAVATNRQGSDSGSLEIFDTTSSTISSWTVTSIRTGTSPALSSARVASVQFDGSSYNIVFTYGNALGTLEYGGIIDASSPVSITQLFAPAAIGSTVGIQSGVVIEGSKIYGVNSTFVFATTKSTGAGSHATSISGLNAFSGNLRPIQYNPSTSEFVVFGTTITRVVDNGASFSQVGTQLSSSTNPRTPGTITTAAQISNDNIVLTGNSGDPIAIYCSAENRLYPSAFMRSDFDFGKQFINNEGAIRVMEVSLTQDWLLSMSASVLFRNPERTGRLRIGHFAYDTGTHQLITAGVDFYDAVNEIRVGTDWDRLCHPSIHRTNEDRIVVAVTRLNYQRIDRPKKVTLGIIESDAQRLQMRATILAETTRLLDMRARIRNSYTQDLDMKALIVFAQCIKMQARIVPRVTYTFTARAAILNTKSTEMIGTFNVQITRQSRILGRFFVDSGYNGSQTVSMGASLVKRRAAKITGHFLVQQPNTNKIQSYVVGFDQISLQTLKIRAGIVKA